MTDTHTHATDSDAPPPLPGTALGGGFTAHAALVAVLFAVLNWMIAGYAPDAVLEIGASYQIQFYHVPSAILMTLAYVMVLVSGVMVLSTGSLVWDRRARAFAAVGMLANGIVLVTGAVWGKAAWNIWWRFDDPKLTSAAVTFMVYLAYAVLTRGIEDETKRPRICAIYGIVAALSLVFIYFAPKWFGNASHPERVKQVDTAISTTLTFGILAFLGIYSLLYRWKMDMETVRERADAALARIRRLEDSRS